ncbi:hypothetical protein COCMIDRAFT_10142 [Bipolaris oryzae ATCC 44560]|uniref:Fumarylacetoacetase-like C-terminal domain-containing protein n=1 Tax=Bipolaris oryzae ATCC 44560 TaxID=930090 RepID=W6YKX9_COCMI|nr:uncharacterized protein COCMIDRAFT_10142 [Bipolaris oryzae ATCC 44560]EUC39857.1 hypothetical protein COCMIDRAFT_10142 [Bipolaris oryzae ATCC 44560]
MASTDSANGHMSLTNYVSFQDPDTGRTRVGHYDLANASIQPLAFLSGTPLDSIYQVIEVGESNIIPFGKTLPASGTRILPPFTGRDILCVGKNYAEHAKEFNSSGFDSSDKVDTPSHPVIFTKRFTSIIGDGEEILPHSDFTETVDYEGEIGVVIGKAGFRISEESAMDHVWGYTIVNDVTARERQRDHKQFYIGKSPDTFCPMGPIAVPASKLDKVLQLETYVNGELRQKATTKDLIFSISYLIKTMSEGQTLMPGDVLATGTPAGVGIGKNPPVYLKPGDTVAVSVSGLGTLTNRIASPNSNNPTITMAGSTLSHIQPCNLAKSIDTTSLTYINNKTLYYKRIGVQSKPPIVFIHGLGGTSDFYTPLIQSLGLENTHSLHLFDMEGHGLSPSSPLSKVSIESIADDVNGIFEKANIAPDATLMAHSMGCLAAVHFALIHPNKISKLILIGPPPSPLPEAGSAGAHARAQTVRSKGMHAVVDAIVAASTSDKTKATNLVAVAAVRMSLLGQDPEGYAKGCTALAEAKALDFAAIQPRTLIITGTEDKVSPPQLCEKYLERLGDKASLHLLENVGHWHVLEDFQSAANAVKTFL